MTLFHTTRFAPSPTGYLHLGHVLSAMYVWSYAKKYSAKVIIRMEDHDRQRSKPEYAQQILKDLEWLGFLTPETIVIFQSQCEESYQTALNILIKNEKVFACECIRKQLPLKDGHTFYPGTCRDKKLPLDGSLSLRIDSGELIRDGKGNWTYLFANVVDDINQDIDLVVRGEDILPFTDKQIKLRSLLITKPAPTFIHHALLFDKDGKKLSKRIFSESINKLKDEGYTKERLFATALRQLMGREFKEEMSFQECCVVIASLRSQ